MNDLELEIERLKAELTKPVRLIIVTQSGFIANVYCDRKLELVGGEVEKLDMNCDEDEPSIIKSEDEIEAGRMFVLF